MLTKPALTLALMAWGHGFRPGSAGGPAAQGANQAPPPFAVAGGRLRVEICTDDIVRVAFAPDEAFFGRPSLMAAPKRCTTPAWKLTKTDERATIATAKLRVNVDLTTGAVSFADAVRQQWEPHGGERLYGLGQHQQGLLDLKGTDLELRQYNGEIFGLVADKMKRVLEFVWDTMKGRGEKGTVFAYDEAQKLADHKKLGNPFSPSHINQMLVVLANAGLIYKNRPGKYSFAVPLLNRFIRRQIDTADGFEDPDGQRRLF